MTRARHLNLFIIVLSALSCMIGARGFTQNAAKTTSVPEFSNGVRLQANGIALRPPANGSPYNYYTAPCITDWNEDGKKDLLVGCFYYGSVYLYINEGTDIQPVFSTGSRLKAGSVDISVSYG